MNSGYIGKDDFRKCVRNMLPCEDTPSLEDMIATLCDNSPSRPLTKVPYPKFLAMFEGTKPRQLYRPSSCRPLVGYPSPFKPLPKVVGTVDSKVQTIMKY